MKAPISPDIARVLQDGRSARALVSAVLKQRSFLGEQSIKISSDGVVKRYKPVAEMYRNKK